MGRKLMAFWLVLLALLVWAPLLLLVAGSFYGEQEILECFGGVLLENGTGVRFHPLPRYPTLRGYVELLLDSPGFFVTFWNSVYQVLPQLAGQLLVGVPAAWAFAHFNFPGRRALFYLYMVLMLLPFQVTMVSGYLVLNRLGLIDTQAAVILPGIFATFFVFLTTKAFLGIPASLLEAAAMDGAGELRIFWQIAAPLLFLWGQSFLEQGIAASGLKE